jgi:AmmeMemoRadiSam system protein A
VTEASGRLTSADGAVLVWFAVTAVEARLAIRPLDGRPPASVTLRALGASFVTLECQGALRGCIGTLEPVRPLYRDVVRNAVRASRDPRLPPVTAAEWPGLDVKVSVLSHAEPLLVTGPAELLATLRPGVDGLILADGRRRATFLPTVWRKLPDPRRFVAALLDKGGWPPGAWPTGLTAQRYTAQEYHAPALRPASFA